MESGDDGSVVDDRDNRRPISRDARDVRTTKTPPRGSPAAQALARVPAFKEADWAEKTDPQATDFEKLQERARRASVAATAAASGTHELRLEVHARLEAVTARMDGVVAELGEVKGAVGSVQGSVNTLVGLVERQVEASIDVGKAHAMQPIEDARSRRALIAKVVGGLFSTAVLTALITALANGRC